MKTIIILLFTFFAINYSIAQTSVKTNTITEKSVPEAVKTTFKNEFPTLQPKWEQDNKNYKAIYADPKTNSKGIITYDPEGKAINRDVETNATVPESK